MVFMEHQGENDFESLFPSVAESVKEEEEKKQTEMFLRLLDDIDTRTNDRHAGSSPPGYRDDDEYSDSSDSEYEEERRRRKPRKRKNRKRPSREYLKVSITDDEKTRKEKQRLEKEEEQKRAELVGRVHTLDDLPPDEMDFAQLFGIPPAPEPPEVNVTAGRRLKDGKIVYNATFPNLNDFGLDIGSFNIQLEYVIIFFLVVFLIGVFIGRRAAEGRFNSKIKKLTDTYNKQLENLRQQFNASTQQIQQQQQQQQPMFVPVPMHQWQTMMNSMAHSQ